jgi:hypothetical protein
MISLKYNFLFIHVPKTAGNSIQEILKEYSEDEIVITAPFQDGVERFNVRSNQYHLDKHSTLKDYKLELGEQVFDRLFKFTCVRNPWDRLVSYYFSPHRGVVEWDKSEFMKFVMQVPPLEAYFALGDHEMHDPRVFTNINNFIRFERIDDDFKRVCKLIGIPGKPLNVRNRSQKQSYQQYYDQEIAEFVRRKFAMEIEYFGYEFKTDTLKET